MTDALIPFLQKLANVIDRFSGFVGRAVSWLTLFMVLTTFAVVVLRYVFNIGWIAMQESVVYMHATVFMLAVAFTLKTGGHVRVDIFYESASPRRKAWVDLLGTVFLLAPVSLFILFSSWDYVSGSWRLLESSREAGGLPAVFLLKSLIPMMAVMLLLQGIAEACRSGLVLLGQVPGGDKY